MFAVWRENTAWKSAQVNTWFMWTCNKDGDDSDDSDDDDDDDDDVSGVH